MAKQKRCGIKAHKIGNTKVPFTSITAAVEAVAEGANITEGLVLGYAKLPTKEVLFKDWEKWFYDQLNDVKSLEEVDSDVNKAVSYINENYIRAIKSAKKKLGQRFDMIGLFTDVMRLDPHLVNEIGMLAEFKEIVENFAQSSKILELGNIETLVNHSNKIINSIHQDFEFRVKENKPKKIDIHRRTYEQDVLRPHDLSKLAEYPASIASNVFEVIDRDTIKLLDTETLRILYLLRNNLERGVFPNAGYEALTTAYVTIKAEELAPIIDKLDIKGIFNFVSRGIATAKSKVDKSLSPVGHQINDTPAYLIDEVFNITEGQPLYDMLVYPLAKGNQQQKVRYEIYDIKSERLRIAHNAHFRTGLGGNSNNDMLISFAGIKLYQLGLEHESNTGGQTPMYYVNNIIDGYDGFKTYTDESVDALEKYVTKFLDKDGEIDINKLYDSFHKVETDIIKFSSETSSEMAPIVAFNAGTLRGMVTEVKANYVHHNLVSEDGTGDAIDDAWMARLRKPGLKTDIYEVRKNPGKAPIMRLFDPLGDTMKTVKMALTDYHLTPAINNSKGIVKKLKDQTKGRNRRFNGDSREAIEGISTWLDAVIRREIAIKTEKYNAVDSLLKETQKWMYAGQLASIPRMVAEAISNVSFVMINNPQEFMHGTSLDIVWDGDKGLEGALQMGSVNTEKMYSTGTFGNKDVPTSMIGSTARRPDRYLSPSEAKFVSIMQAIFDNQGIVGLRNMTEKLTDILLRTPDKMIVVPLYWGIVDITFENETGDKLDYSLLVDKGEKGRAYRTKHKEALYNANKAGDVAAIRAGASTENIVGIGKITRDPNDSLVQAGYKKVASFMMKFQLFEYSATMTAIKSAVGNGSLTPEQGIRLMAATTMRQSIYMPAYMGMLAAVYALLGFDDEDEYDFVQDMKFSLLGVVTATALQRNFTAFPREGMAWLIEIFNEKYLEGLRNGEKYDPWDHNLAFRILSERDFNTNNKLGAFWKFTGPYSVIAKDINNAVRSDNIVLEFTKVGAAYTGHIPIYKDVNRIWSKYKRKNNIK